MPPALNLVSESTGGPPLLVLHPWLALHAVALSLLNSNLAEDLTNGPTAPKLLLLAGADLQARMHGFSLFFTSSDRLLNLPALGQHCPTSTQPWIDFLYQTLDELVIVPAAEQLKGGGVNVGCSSRG